MCLSELIRSHGIHINCTHKDLQSSYLRPNIMEILLYIYSNFVDSQQLLGYIIFVFIAYQNSDYLFKLI